MATSQEIYREINSAINSDNSTKKPTMGWIAGTFKKTYDFDRMQRAVEGNSHELDSQTLQDFKNALKLRDIALKNGLMVRGKDGGYKVTDKGSKFVQETAKKITEWQTLLDKDFKGMRAELQSGKGFADMAWYESLPPNEKHVIDSFGLILPREFHFLIGLKNAKDSKDRYVNKINTWEEKNFESYSILRDIGFITSKNTLNVKMVDAFFNVLSKYDYEHLRSFNRNLSSSNDTIAATNGLRRNELERAFDKKSPRSSDVALHAKEFVSSINNCTKSWIIAMAKGPGHSVKCSQVDFEDLKLNGVVDSIKEKTLTSYGTLVASLLKNDTIPDDGEDASLNSRMPMGATSGGSRQAQRSKILQGRGTRFNSLLNRTKTEESIQTLSFKKYLIEQSS